MTEQPPHEAQPDSLTFELLRDAWAAQSIEFDNASEDHVLFQDEARVIYLDSSWGPPIGYGPARRPDGNQNHGYVATKGNPEAIAAIPELQGWPEYEALILAINSATGPTETVGCEKHFSTAIRVLPRFISAVTRTLFSAIPATTSLRITFA
jgi:hypothetical protein